MIQRLNRLAVRDPDGASMVVIGGKRSIVGVIIGAVVLTALPELLRDLKDWYPTFYGVLLLLTLWLAPNGLVVRLEEFSFLRRRPPVPAKQVGAVQS